MERSSATRRAADAPVPAHIRPSGIGGRAGALVHPPALITGPPDAAPPAHGAPARKRSVGDPEASASLRCVLPGLKRLRRDAPSSPTSVGDVSAPKESPAAGMTSPAATAAAATAPASAKLQSVLRGLTHLAACSDAGCSNALCASTRNFVAKVRTHEATAAARPGHDRARCGACQLWAGILRAHVPACTAPRCCVPGCSRA